MVESLFTSSEVEEQHNISRTLLFDWFDILEAKGLVRRAPGREWGTKLLSQTAIDFLLSRKGKVGSPGVKWSKAAHLDAWLEGEGECQQS